MAQRLVVPTSDGWREVPEGLWPAFLRVATDDARVTDALDQLDGTTLELLGPVEVHRRVRLSQVTAARWRPDLADPAAARRYASVLAGAWLASSDGADDPELATWDVALPRAAHVAGAALSYDDAVAALAAAGFPAP